MPINRRDLILSALASTALVGLPRLSLAADQPAPVTGGTLIVGSNVEPVHLVGAFTTQAGPPTAKLFDGLVDFGLDGHARPALAKSWSFSPDGLKLTFNLREGVKWHDGTTLTSKDVVFSLGVWKKYNARARTSLAAVQAVEAPDDLTVVLTLSKPSPAILFAFEVGDSPVLAQHTYPADGDLSTDPRNNNPIGTGPFKLDEWNRGSYVSLKRNPDYWDKGKPYLDQIVIQTVPDAAAVAAAIESNTVHAADYVPLSNIVRLKQEQGLQVIDDPRGTLFFVGAVVFEFNLDRPQFRDRAIREAIAHAIDRDYIQKNLFFGFATPTATPIPPGLPDWHNANVPTYPFDLDKSASILDAAGYKPDSNGQRLHIFNDYAANSPVHLQIAQYLRSNLAKIGVTLEVRNQDFGAFVDRTYTKRDFDTVIYHATVGPDPAIGAQRLYWSKNFKPGVAFSNASHYDNAEVDQLLEAAAVEIDVKKRKDLYDKFQNIVQTDLVRIPIVSPHYPIVARSTVQNYITVAEGESGSFSETFLTAS